MKWLSELYFRVLKSEFMFYLTHSWCPEMFIQQLNLWFLCVLTSILLRLLKHIWNKKMCVFTVESKTTNLQLYISFYKMFCPVKKFHILLNVNALKPPQYSFTSNSVSFTLLSVDSLIPLEEFDLRPQWLWNVCEK